MTNTRRAEGVRFEGGGPYFEELSVGDAFESAPALTLTSGMADTHRAILGDRMRLSLDTTLSRRVTGADTPLAPPALVWNVAIGQSTTVTHHVVANLFYRGLVFRRYPVIGDTLHTRTEVVGLRQNSRKPGRAPTGLAALRVTTTDQAGRPVLDFVRCAMLPLGDQSAETGHADDFVGITDTDAEAEEKSVAAQVGTWDLTAFPSAGGAGVPPEGQVVAVQGGDVVSSAPELARLTLNIAAVHHDATASSEGRLVYGGHTIGLALSQANRVLPDLITVTGWRGCDHTGPVREGDTLHSELEIESVEPFSPAAQLIRLRSQVWARSTPQDQPRFVLDWRYTALLPRGTEIRAPHGPEGRTA
ncbi:MaoC family dehydratase [Streptomyces melanosporofaciens]|uniref:Acyl dehydratase n=1 Tax=Streptomyces melanosporofaciens TaxID=67327 RepID=A0A1H4I8U8_STRMJ|nr:MaoC family dehydratase [Streptomyces melanosporofaciens]SEB30411.1 Acyl dehydratase [Streptomyces melanosporofaciens]